jgi:hypothetical protein
MTSQGKGDCRESVLSCLRRVNRAGRDRAYHSRQGSGARRPSIYDALHAGRRLVSLIYFEDVAGWLLPPPKAYTR